MGKLMRVTRGVALLVAVDIRKSSRTFGKWHSILASEQNKVMIYAPAGFARGFFAKANNTEVQYKCTGEYNGEAEGAIRWDDPDIGIEWPFTQPPLISEKDANAQTLAEWCARPESDLF